MKVALCFFLLSLYSFSLAEVIRITIRGENSIATTDDNFICANLDRWPKEKCNYYQCPWGNTSILNLDFQNKIFMNAIKAFNPLRIRVGGSLQDLVVYDVGNADANCPGFKLDRNGLFGFGHGCLPRKKWDELHHLFNQTGALVEFGLNALYGKNAYRKGILWVGAWDPQNGRDLIKYTMTKGYKIDSYELGNELCGYGVSAKLDSVQYAKDIIVQKNLVKELYPDAPTRPKVLGPAGFYEEKWFISFLETIGPEVVDGVTHHIHNLGSGVDPNLINKVQNPLYLNYIAQTYEHVSRSVQKYAPLAAAWVGEGGGAYNSGGRNVQDRFVENRYLDQLRMASTLNHKVYCRQALIGGYYGLLNTTTFVPNRDYYGALLWHRLMGKEVLKTSHNGSPYLRAYSHCSRQHRPGVAMLLINLSSSTFFDVTIIEDFNLHWKQFESRSQRGEYHLTAKDGNIQSDVVLLNGSPLQLSNSSDIPQMEPVLVDSSFAIRVAPHSFVFVVLKDIKAPACA